MLCSTTTTTTLPRARIICPFLRLVRPVRPSSPRLANHRRTHDAPKRRKHCPAPLFTRTKSLKGSAATTTHPHPHSTRTARRYGLPLQYHYPRLLRTLLRRPCRRTRPNRGHRRPSTGQRQEDREGGRYNGKIIDEASSACSSCSRTTANRGGGGWIVGK